MESKKKFKVWNNIGMIGCTFYFISIGIMGFVIIYFGFKLFEMIIN